MTVVALFPHCFCKKRGLILFPIQPPPQAAQDRGGSLSRGESSLELSQTTACTGTGVPAVSGQLSWTEGRTDTVRWSGGEFTLLVQAGGVNGIGGFYHTWKFWFLSRLTCLGPATLAIPTKGWTPALSSAWKRRTDTLVCGVG